MRDGIYNSVEIFVVHFTVSLLTLCFLSNSPSVYNINNVQLLLLRHLFFINFIIIFPYMCVCVSVSVYRPLYVSVGRCQFL